MKEALLCLISSFVTVNFFIPNLKYKFSKLIARLLTFSFKVLISRRWLISWSSNFCFMFSSCHSRRLTFCSNSSFCCLSSRIWSSYSWIKISFFSCQRLSYFCLQFFITCNLILLSYNNIMVKRDWILAKNELKLLSIQHTVPLQGTWFLQKQTNKQTPKTLVIYCTTL